MARVDQIKKVMVIGSGPIVIGQAAEFDYAGTQACQALREEGVEVVLVNSNPATIMTDTNIADRVYMEPLTVDFITSIIVAERPDGLLATLGGQTALNLALELEREGVLAKYEVQLLGTDMSAIKKAEDRELFRATMQQIGEVVPESKIIYKYEEALTFIEEIGFPVIVRPAYTLGGTGGGIAYNHEQFKSIVANGIDASPIKQVLIERSLLGLIEIEYEIVRDAAGNKIVVCNMENVDPVGVHTGDSIVVAPSLTLSEKAKAMFRSSAFNIVDAVGIQGSCNVQYAYDPKTEEYFVIEVNPRVSRSSALASKATGYPIAKVATKIALGYKLPEIINQMTKDAPADIEPQLDYIVTKIPRWPFDKFITANRFLGTQMKATGEVMAIGQTFEESLQKAIRSLEIKAYGLYVPSLKLAEIEEELLLDRITYPDDERLFVIAEWFRRGGSISRVIELTGMESYFLERIKGLVDLEEEIAKAEITKEKLLNWKVLGFADRQIAILREVNEREIYRLRLNYGIIPEFLIVDTFAGKYELNTPYYYSSYQGQKQTNVTEKESVIVLGSGPIRIGQGIEFDYSTVHAIWAIQEAGYEAIIINNNPETVSTDYNISDRLYFEPLTEEDVLNVVAREKPIGVVVQLGGQTAINLAARLVEEGINILGTSLDSIANAENRKKFEALARKLGIKQPLGSTAMSVIEAVAIAERIGYPVLVRPSYVLGGRAMEIIYNVDDLKKYMVQAVNVSTEHPVLIDRYLTGKEIEVDAICDGTSVLIPGIMEHIEKAGIHSGDSVAVYPTISLSEEMLSQIIDMTKKLALGLNIIGLLNIQFVIFNGEPYVIEVNPRSSRTVPFISKVTGIPMGNIGTKVILGQSIIYQGYQPGYYQPLPDYYAVKAPVFSFSKLRSVDVTLGPEMKSTGEVIGIDSQFAKAIYKGLVASGIKIPEHGTILATIADKGKEESVDLFRRFERLGYRIKGTKGTADYLNAQGIPVKQVSKLQEGSPNIIDEIRNNQINIVINTLTKGKDIATDGYKIRRESVEFGIPCITSLDTAYALLHAIESISFRLQPFTKNQGGVIRR